MCFQSEPEWWDRRCRDQSFPLWWSGFPALPPPSGWPPCAGFPSCCARCTCTRRRARRESLRSKNKNKISFGKVKGIRITEKGFSIRIDPFWWRFFSKTGLEVSYQTYFRCWGPRTSLSIFKESIWTSVIFLILKNSKKCPLKSVYCML